ncbi:hypothetical protein PsorP6_007276 [Peronosclerospora sorghi]|uniref:Uncharacterized protein n=1 Tax=Peronosclerospora sorghi TaxID=230839 RepID=A0ACC0W8S4_9STRA|nr:hypothetical protein PsorP6_007276 [Peronosclerospora sorghi]
MLKPMGKKHVPHPHSRLDEWRSPTHSFKSSILLPAPLRPLLVHTGATLRLQLRYQKYQDKVRALLKKANANEPHEQRGTTGRRRRLKTSSIALAVAIQTVKDEKEENKGTTSLCFQSEGSVGEPWSSSMKLENEWNVMMSMDERLGCFKTTESQEEASDPVAETTSEAFFGLKRDVGSQNVDERPRQLVNIMEPAWLVASIEQRCAATTQVRARPSMRISSPSFVRQFLDVRMAGRDLVFIARSGVGVNLHSQAPAPPDMHLRTLRRRLHEAQSDALHHLSALDPTQVTRVFQSLQSDMWMPAVRCLGWLLTKLWRLLFAGLYVDLASLHHARRVLEAAQGDVSVVFAPTHKSHLDYLIISYLCFAYGIPLPRIAAGNNLDLPLIGSFLRANGSFFIRRSFRDDDVYKQVLEHYVHVLLDDGNPLEVFLEGGRSRHGRVGKPRLGFLSMLLNYVKKTQRSEGLVNNRKKTVLLVPLSLDYDKVYEVDGYVNQLLGKPKEKESLAGFLRSVWDLLSVRLGHAYVRFGEPVSLTATSSLPDASTLVAERMQTSGTITSTAIVAALLMWKRAYVTEAMLATRSTWLLQELEQRAAAVMHMAPTDLIPHALSMLNVQTNSNQVVVSYVQFPVRALELGYYRNHLLHIFLLDMAVFGALDAALREQVESNECVRTVEMGVIQQHARKIWDFLRHICRHPQIDVAASVTRLLARAPGCHWHERAGTVAVDGHVWKTCKLTSFVLSLHWSFSDSLWLTTQGLWYVLDQATDVVTERGFVRCVQMLAKAMLRRAQLVHAEALCRESIQQSLEYLVDTGVVRTEFVPEHASRVVRLCSTSAERVRTLTQEVNLRRKPLTFLWREDQAPRNLTRHEALELMAAARSASSVYATWMTPLTSL